MSGWALDLGTNISCMARCDQSAGQLWLIAMDDQTKGILFFAFAIAPIVIGLLINGIKTSREPRLYPERGKRFRKCFDELMKVAGAAGLTELRATTTGLAGKAEAFEVRLDREGPEEYARITITISGLGHRRPGVNLQRSRTGVRRDKGSETGDAAFDAEVCMNGKIPLARALLDAETRKSVRGIIGGRLPLDGGWEVEVEARVSEDQVIIEVGGPLIAPETGWLRGKTPVTDNRLPDVIRAAVAFARRLVAPPGSLAVRIAENLRAEAHGEVGLRCLHALLEWFPKHPATREALLVAVKEGSVQVRLRAAIALGEEGREALIALALETDTLEKDAAEPFRVRAIEALGAHIPREVAEQVYTSALANGETRAAAACLAALGRIGGDESVAVLGRALGESGGELGAAAARALGETSLASAEAPLLANLERGGTVTLACAEALGRVGSIRAVPRLLERAAGSPNDRQLGRAVRQAVAEIQSRLEGAEPGQLSLAAAGAGELSVVDASGRLTVAGGEAAGRLSVSPGDASGRLTVSPEDAGGRLALPEEERREPLPRARSRQLEGPNG